MMERAVALTIDYVRQRRRSARRSSSSRTPSSSCRLQDRGDRRQGVLRPCIERASEGRARHRHRLDGQVLGTDALGKVVDRCLQLFGGYGYMDEYPISRIYRDARVMRIYAGTNEIMKLVIARSL
jgi:acyl-CoA dehydrogenase